MQISANGNAETDDWDDIGTYHVRPFRVMNVLQRAQELQSEGRSIIHMEVGEPDFPTPACVTEAAAKALKDGCTKYTHSQGIIPLREAISEYYHEQYNINVSPDRIIVTVGSSAALSLALLAVVNNGDTLLLTDPTYACYHAFSHLPSARRVLAPLDSSDSFQIHAEQLKPYIGKTKAMILNSPANPTGMMMARDLMAEIANSGTIIISDEIYHGLTYERKPSSILEFSDECFAVDGFSKRYAMTGWRLGWVVAPKDKVSAVQSWQSNLYISACHFAQMGGIAALKEAKAEVEAMRIEYHKRRDYLVERLREMNFPIPAPPQGAYYLFADASHIDENALRLSSRLLEETGVAVAPGEDFGKQCHSFLRFSYCISIEKIGEAMDRIAVWLKSHVA